ncbi:MAG: acyl-CoA reductase [Clostridia bacterium]|nr:acyl-CoA reductase [Clostridia bacterium]
MQTNSDKEVLKRVAFLTGSADTVEKTVSAPAMVPFDEKIINFLNDVSAQIMSDRRSRAYSDVITFGFWIRKSSVLKLKDRFDIKDNAFRIGKGVAFHIAPSNVPVNFAYSLVTGLLNGNANIVRVPSKDFPQIAILTDAFNKALLEHPSLQPYVVCVRYGRNKEINDLFSAVADVRLVWGGDKTIEELRKSPLPPRSGEITFADRYSIAVIDSDKYLCIEDKKKTAEDFYNDTFLSDQNACTSPRIIVWTGSQIDEAKKIFWEAEHDLVEKKYSFQAIQGINKLTQCFMAGAALDGIKVVPHKDNLIVRVAVSQITDTLMDYRDNSGYFYEFDCNDISLIKPVCNDKRCQTIAYIGDSETIIPLLQSGVKGVDRIVPIGKTMDFDLIWDGYNLSALLTRTVAIL